MRYTFQHQIATGRSTFPVAVLISLALWIFPFENKTELLSLLAGGLTTYLLIEMNTSFALIRTRTELPSALFLCLYSSLLFLHPYQHTCWIQLLFMGTLLGLFSSYESKNAPIHIFHAFLCLGISTLLVNNLVWTIPFLFCSMAILRSVNPRIFFAALLGLIIPYWMLLGYELAMNFSREQVIEGFGITSLIHNYFNDVIPIGFSWEGFKDEYMNIGLVKGVSYGITLFISLVGSALSIRNSYSDKVRTRCFIGALVPLEIGIVLLTLLKPSLIDAFLPIQAIFATLTCSYVFALVFTRFVCYFLVTVLGLIGGIMLLNLWTLYFNF